LKEKIAEREMPEKINEAALKELQRYERIPQSSAESSVIRNYLDWLIDLPWHNQTEDTIEIEKDETILNEYHYRLEKVKEQMNKANIKELKRYERIPQSSAESSVIRNYLDWLIDLPWHNQTEDTIEIEKAETILNEDHYGLEKVKERIIEYLAVQKLTDSIK